MDANLIYDTATMSRIPQQVLLVACALAGWALGLWVWARWRGRPRSGLFSWLVGAAGLMLLVSAGSEWEKRWIASNQDVKQVQGSVQAVWNDRVLRAGSRNDYWKWQGFSIEGVGFRYVRNSGSNYFGNQGAGPDGQALDLTQPGLQLRVHYIEQVGDKAVERHIVRVERLG